MPLTFTGLPASSVGEKREFFAASFDVASWKEVSEGTGRLELFVTPKELDD